MWHTDDKTLAILFYEQLKKKKRGRKYFQVMAFRLMNMCDMAIYGLIMYFPTKIYEFHYRTVRKEVIFGIYYYFALSPYLCGKTVTM